MLVEFESMQLFTAFNITEKSAIPNDDVCVPERHMTD